MDSDLSPEQHALRAEARAFIRNRMSVRRALEPTTWRLLPTPSARAGGRNL